MAELTDRITRLGPQTVRALALGGVLAVVAVVSALLAVAGVDTVEVVATLLVVPVFGVALYLGQAPGLAAAAVACAVYIVLRRPDLDSTGVPSFAVLVLARALAYGVVVYAGTWVRQAVAAGAGGDERGQLGPIGAADDRGLRAEPTAARSPVFVFDQAGAARRVPVGVAGTAVHGASSGAGPGAGGPDDHAGGPGGWDDDEPHPSEWRVGPSALPPDDPEARPWTAPTAFDEPGLGPDGRPAYGSFGGPDDGPRTGTGLDAGDLGADVWDEPLGAARRTHAGPPHDDRWALPTAGATHEAPGSSEADRRQASHDDFWGTRPGDDEGWGGAPTTGGRDPWGAPSSGRVPAATGPGPGPPGAPAGQGGHGADDGAWGPAAGPGGDDPWGPPTGPPSATEPAVGTSGPPFSAHSGERPAVTDNRGAAPGAPGGPPQFYAHSGEAPAVPDERWSGEAPVVPDERWSGEAPVVPDERWSGEAPAVPDERWSGEAPAVPDERWSGGRHSTGAPAVPGPPGGPGLPGAPAGPQPAREWDPPTGDPAGQGAHEPTTTPGPWEQIRPPERWEDPPPRLDPHLPPPGAPRGRGASVSGRKAAVGGAAAGSANGRGRGDPVSGRTAAVGGAPAAAGNDGEAAAMPAVDPETRLWSARFLCDRLAAEQRQAAGGRPFSLVLVQVPDGPLAALSYRRQVTLLRELGHQFVAGGIVDHLVHVPDQAQHWFAAVLPGADKRGAEAFESRLRNGIGGYLRSRGLLLGELDSATLTSPDDDAAMGAIWEALIARGDPSSSPEPAFDY